MSITNELRDWSRDNLARGADMRIAELADRIDESHEVTLKSLGQAQDERDEYLESCRLWESKCRSMVELPRDADGEPVRVGDVMEWPDGKVFDVIGIGEGVLFYTDDEECAEWTGASTKRHHKPPTVEDVLREFAKKVCEGDHIVKDGKYLGIEDVDLLSEYVAKLQLRESE